MCSTVELDRARRPVHERPASNACEAGQDVTKHRRPESAGDKLHGRMVAGASSTEPAHARCSVVLDMAARSSTCRTHRSAPHGHEHGWTWTWTWAWAWACYGHAPYARRKPDPRPGHRVDCFQLLRRPGWVSAATVASEPHLVSGDLTRLPAEKSAKRHETTDGYARPQNRLGTCRTSIGTRYLAHSALD